MSVFNGQVKLVFEYFEFLCSESSFRKAVVLLTHGSIPIIVVEHPYLLEHGQLQLSIVDSYA